MKKILGFIVNPAAGVGGRVGLKGSDGVLEEAFKRGGKEISPERAKAFFKAFETEFLSGFFSEALFLTCSGCMGEDIIKNFNEAENYKVNYEAVYFPKKDKTTSEDTRKACEIFLNKKAELILFCGGDGTARDVSSVVSDKIPVLGIPSGVKMYSSCFAVTPEAASRVASDFISGKAELKDAEILDIDENAYRKDKMEVKLFSHVKTPYIKEYVQDSKTVFSSADEERMKKEIALFCIEFMKDSSLYIIGPGTTTKKIFELLGIEKTLLGVDAVKDGNLIAKDLNEKQILELTEKYNNNKFKIIVSPLGKQGFIFGRGNQQISDAVIEKAGTENIIIIGTPQKLQETDKLFVDTGNPKINKMLSGKRLVVCGYRLAQRKEVVSI